jgi:osmotically-inducible protein OsmY
VEVGTLDGRVTLRGHVNTDEGKRVIGEIAAKAVRPENVSNLLEVRPVPVTGK